VVEDVEVPAADSDRRLVAIAAEGATVLKLDCRASPDSMDC
jgi:hypothetical protein